MNFQPHAAYEGFRKELGHRIENRSESIIRAIYEDILKQPYKYSVGDKQILGAIASTIQYFIKLFSVAEDVDAVAECRNELEAEIAATKISTKEYLNVYHIARMGILDAIRNEVKELLPDLKPERLLDLLHALYLYEELLFTSLDNGDGPHAAELVDGISAEGYRTAMRLLNGDGEPPVTHIDDYALAGPNTAVAIWDAQAQEVNNHLLSLLSTTDLLALPGEHGVSMVCWTKMDYPQLLGRLNQANFPPSWRLAVSDSVPGAEGFRRAYHQVYFAHRIARLASDKAEPVTFYSDISALSFLMQSPAQAADWVRGVLGGLAEETPSAERLRETLYTYWRCQKNAAQTASRMFLHRNTVNYRIAQARDLVPERSWDNPLNIPLALTYMHYIPLGQAEI